MRLRLPSAFRTAPPTVARLASTLKACLETPLYRFTPERYHRHRDLGVHGKIRSENHAVRYL